MAFVNEYMSDEDIKKYGIEEIDKFFNKAHHLPKWTVDRDQDIYLRYLQRGREETARETDFSFYWKGSHLFVRVNSTGGGEYQGPCWDHYSHLRMGSPDQYYCLDGVSLPEPLKASQAKIVADLKDALIAYKDFGVLSISTTHTATFDF